MEAFADASGRIVKGFKDYTRLSGDGMPLVYLVVDEMNALMGYAKKDDRLESALGVLLQMGRSAGVNVLMGAQHLTADVLPKGYYTNIATRVMLGAYDAANTSRLLGTKPAPELIPLLTGQPGRALVRSNGAAGAIAVQMLRVDEQDMLDSMAYARGVHGPRQPEAHKMPGNAWETAEAVSEDGPNGPDADLLAEMLFPVSDALPAASGASPTPARRIGVRFSAPITLL